MKKVLSSLVVIACGFCILSLPAYGVSISADDALSAEEYQKAQNNYQEKLDQYKVARNQWKQTKQSQNINSATELIRYQDAKNLANKGLDAGEAFLNMFKTRINLSSSLSDELKNSTTANIDTHLGWLSTQRQDLGNTPQDLESLGSNMTAIQSQWQIVRTDLMRQLRLIQLSKLQNATDQIERTISSAEQALAASSPGMTTADQAQIQNHIQRLKDSLNTVKDNMSRAHAIFSITDDLMNAAEEYATGAALLEAANDEIMRNFALIAKFVTTATPQIEETQ